ncbi:competence type IV pilus major pilin ComGC [Bacillus sp. Hm123]|uniref:competence type IV pilus major pilin ComGC n=1 Tax=Bacillus sp. Hm123 TaxID=3450745 RepID=UPI003F4382F9
MRKILKDNQGFTLIEMMIVLLVISVLLFIAIPNVAKQSKNINNKGCDAFKRMVEGQVQAFRIEEKKYPATVQEMVDKEYLKKDETSCPNGDKLAISADGEVTVAK